VFCVCVFTRLVFTSMENSLQQIVTTHTLLTTGLFTLTNEFTLPSWLSEPAGKVCTVEFVCSLSVNGKTIDLINKIFKNLKKRVFLSPK